MRNPWWNVLSKRPVFYNNWPAVLELEHKNYKLAVLKDPTADKFVVGYKSDRNDLYNITSIKHRTQSAAVKKLMTLRKALEFVELK